MAWIARSIVGRIEFGDEGVHAGAIVTPKVDAPSARWNMGAAWR